MIVELNNKTYHICNNEFTTITHTEYNNLIIKDQLGHFERIVSLLCELSKLNNFDLITNNQTHGGFVPIKKTELRLLTWRKISKSCPCDSKSRTTPSSRSGRCRYCCEYYSCCCLNCKIGS